MSGEAEVKTYLETVSVNIYDIHWTSRFSAWMGLGIYHSAVVVYGREFAYGGHVYRDSGIYSMTPKALHELEGSENMRFRCTLDLGKTAKSPKEVRNTVKVMGLKWRGKDYNLLRNNCNDFSNEFSVDLCGTGLPSWVNRLARYAGPLIEPFVPKSWIRFQPLPGTPSMRPKAQPETTSADHDQDTIVIALDALEETTFELKEDLFDLKNDLVDPPSLDDSCACTSGDEASNILTEDSILAEVKTEGDGHACSDAEVDMSFNQNMTVGFPESTGRKLTRALSESALLRDSCCPASRRRSLSLTPASLKHIIVSFDSTNSSSSIKTKGHKRSTSTSHRYRNHRSRPELRKSRRRQQHPKPGGSKSKRSRRITKQAIEVTRLNRDVSSDPCGGSTVKPSDSENAKF